MVTTRQERRKEEGEVREDYCVCLFMLVYRRKRGKEKYTYERKKKEEEKH